jgi:hypothetical protein
MTPKDEHPSFKKPRNGDQKIWRYMDFTKFIDLLISDSLYFSRSDKFSDSFEGSLPRMTYNTRRFILNNLIGQGKLLPQYEDGKLDEQQGRENLRSMYINC